MEEKCHQVYQRYSAARRVTIPIEQEVYLFSTSTHDLVVPKIPNPTRLTLALLAL